MAWEATAEVQRFDEAAEWFRSKIPVTSSVADTLGKHAGPRAWTIAGVEQLEVVQMTFESLAKALESGVPFEEWKTTIEPTLTEAWGKRDSARLETVFRNATQSAYNAGRWRQMNEPSVRHFRPYIMFDGVADSRQSDICKHWDGTIRPIDDPCWQTISPPCHHRCRSGLRNMRESEALRVGLTETLPEDQAQQGFGAIPTESEWKPDRTDYAKDLFDEYQLKRQELSRQSKRARLDE